MSPTRAPRPCRQHSCSQICRDGSGYCKEHKRETGWSTESRHKRGYGTRWTKLRRAVFARDKKLCLPCKAIGLSTVATQVDHIVPKSRGGDDTLSNLQSICTKCHKVKTQAEANGLDPKAIGCDEDGIPRDTNHHWCKET